MVQRSLRARVSRVSGHSLHDACEVVRQGCCPILSHVYHVSMYHVDMSDVGGLGLLLSFGPTSQNVRSKRGQRGGDDVGTACLLAFASVRVQDSSSESGKAWRAALQGNTCYVLCEHPCLFSLPLSTDVWGPATLAAWRLTHSVLASSSVGANCWSVACPHACRCFFPSQL